MCVTLSQYFDEPNGEVHICKYYVQVIDAWTVNKAASYTYTLHWKQKDIDLWCKCTDMCMHTNLLTGLKRTAWNGRCRVKLKRWVPTKNYLKLTCKGVFKYEIHICRLN